jgi:hypothetical protein
MAAVVVAGIVARRVVGALPAGAVVVAGVVSREIVGALPAGAVVVVGVVARRVVGAGRGRLHAAVVIVRVVSGGIVGPVCGHPPAMVLVMGVVAREIIVPTPDHPDLGRVLESVVDLMSQPAGGGQRHAPLQGLQRESSLASSSMRYHERLSCSVREIHRASPIKEEPLITR